MKKIITVGMIAFLAVNAQAQTKKIAHRSHSGKNTTLIMTTNDNFGLPKERKADTAKAPAPTVKKKTTKRKTATRKKVTAVTR